jgi:hypothetical protein
MTAPPFESTVPCNGCTACCRNELVTIEPEDGDPGQWLTQPATDPLSGEQVLRLAAKADGACHYLGPKGCTIYDRRPVMCRAFDCRGMVRMLGALEAVKLAAAGDPVIKAGLSRTYGAAA